MKLHRADKISNARKGQYDGVSVTTFAFGSPELYEWLDGNEAVAFLPVETVNSPEVIGANDDMISINGALACRACALGRYIQGRRGSLAGSNCASISSRLDDCQPSDAAICASTCCTPISASVTAPSRLASRAPSSLSTSATWAYVGSGYPSSLAR